MTLMISRTNSFISQQSICSSAPAYTNCGSKPTRVFKSSLVDDREAISATKLDPAVLSPNFYTHYFWPIERPSDLSSTPTLSLEEVTLAEDLTPDADLIAELAEAEQIVKLRNLFKAIQNPDATKEDFNNAVEAVKEECHTLNIQYPDCGHPFTSVFRVNGQEHICYYDRTAPLCHAVAEAEYWKVKNLVEAGASVDYRNDCDGLDPISMSVTVGRGSITKYLISTKSKLTVLAAKRGRSCASNYQRSLHHYSTSSVLSIKH